MKSWYTSKTIWVNALALIGSVMLYFYPSITGEQWAGISGTVLAVANIVLRLVTGESISLSGSSDVGNDGGTA